MIGFMQHRRALMLRDDRGVPRPIRSPHLKWQMKADEAKVLWYRLARVRRDRESSVTRCVGWGVVIVTCLLLGSVGTHAASTGDPNRSVLMFVFVPPVIALGYIWRRQMEVAIERLEAGRVKLPPVCPSCHYDLVGLSSQSDGCTVCPECGAAWRFTPIQSNPDQAC